MTQIVPRAAELPEWQLERLNDATEEARGRPRERTWQMAEAITAGRIWCASGVAGAENYLRYVYGSEEGEDE